MNDTVMILVTSFPMFLFAAFPAIKLANYLEDSYGINEKQKRIVMVTTLLLFSLTLSSLYHFVKF